MTTQQEWENQGLENRGCRNQGISRRDGGNRDGLSGLGGALGLAIAGLLFSAPASYAQKQALPPPPSVPGTASQLELAPLNGTIPASALPELPTTGYPQAPPPQLPGQIPGQIPGQVPGQVPDNYGPAYQVIVYGDSPYLLRQIQFLEPGALIQEYQGRRVIVAGMFDSEAAARQRLLTLGQRGIGAQMLAVNPAVSGQRLASLSPAPVAPLNPALNAPFNSPLNSGQYPAPLISGATPSGTAAIAPVSPLAATPAIATVPSPPIGAVSPVAGNSLVGNSLASNPGGVGLKLMPHFQVIVPTAPENFAAIANKMVSMGVRPEAIQAKQKPLGPHIAVGPFMQQDEAEAVTHYLRVGGMDARVYFAK